MIPVTKTFLPPIEEYTALLQTAWNSAWITNRGALLRKLEEDLKQMFGLKNFLITTNGTLPIQLAIRALELKKEIITTPFSYVATTSSIVWENCQPVFADIEKDSLNIDPKKIEALITENTSGILATHVYGNPCDVDAIDSIAKKYKIKVIYDAAHAFGVTYKGNSIFNYGDIATCSFHATKIFHTGEGGSACVKDDEVFFKLDHMHRFGHNGPYAFHGAGINAKTSELQAAMGLAVLPYLNMIFTNRKKISEWYLAKLSNSGLTFLKIREHTEFNHAYFPVIFKSEAELLKAMEVLEVNQIFTRRYFYPSLNTLSYISKKQSCPLAEDISRKVLCLPLYHDLSLTDVERISDLIIGSLKS